MFATSDPTQEMHRTYIRFCSFGKGHRIPHELLKMDSRTFQKFCRDAGLVDSTLNSTRVDLIFTKLTKRSNLGQKTKQIDFDSFIYSLQECSQVLGLPYLTVQNHILDSKVSPSLGGARRAPQLTSVLARTESFRSSGTGKANAYTVRRADPNDLAAVVSLRIAFALEQDASRDINSARVTQGVTAGLVVNSTAGLLQPRYYVATVQATEEIVGMIGVTPEWNDLLGNCK